MGGNKKLRDLDAAKRKHQERLGRPVVGIKAFADRPKLEPWDYDTWEAFLALRASSGGEPIAIGEMRQAAAVWGIQGEDGVIDFVRTIQSMEAAMAAAEAEEREKVKESDG